MRLDKVLFKYLLFFYGIAFLLSTVSGFLAKWGDYAFTSFTWGELMTSMVVRYSTKFLFVCLAVFFVRYLAQTRRISNWLAMLMHGIFGVGLAFYSIASQVILNNWLFGLEDPLTMDYVYPRALVGTDYNFFLYFCSAAIVYAYDYFKKQKDYQLKEATLKAQLLDSKMHSLQSQLQPHFLFNTLNDISSLVDEDSLKAQDSIADLSDMLRQTLALNDTKLVTMEEEVALLKKYVALEKIRYAEKLNVHWNIPETTLTYRVPPLLFQPIIENAIKHGFSYTHDTVSILVDINHKKGYLSCDVVNTGNPLGHLEIPYGIGLSNVINRLETLYNGDFVFEMTNRKDGVDGVWVKVVLPV